MPQGMGYPKKNLAQMGNPIAKGVKKALGAAPQGSIGGSAPRGAPTPKMMKKRQMESGGF